MTKAKHSKAMVQRTKAAIRSMTRVLPRVGACLFLLDTSTPAVYRKAPLRVRSLPPPREGDPLSHAWFGGSSRRSLRCLWRLSAGFHRRHPRPHHDSSASGTVSHSGNGAGGGGPPRKR